jgi:MoxR-like ATPase
LIQSASDGFRDVSQRVGERVLGQESALRLAFVTLLCSGHSLIEGVPGVAKTLLVRTLSEAIDLRFGRIQFTPDLMPGDIIGTPILDPQQGELRFRPGPIFSDLMLADEINRAPAKTQAALLEAMQESHVTVDGESHDLGAYFTVFATQNPVEHEGTYPLPEAQLDRFLFKIVMDYPDESAEQAMLAMHHVRSGGVAQNLSPVLDRASLGAMRESCDAVVVRDEIVHYVSSLVRATRSDFQFALGASPRAGLLLLRAAKANAAIEGRDYVLPEDVQEMWAPALRHRVVLDPAQEVEGLTPDQALERSRQTVTVPR